MARRYTTEDRSYPDKVQSTATRKENLTLQDLVSITDWSDFELDKVVDMARGSKLLIDGWLYVKRTDK